MSRLIILDRDGVINRDSPDYIKNEAEWIPLPGSLEAIARLYSAGWTIRVATNQSGVGRGYYSLEMMHRINDKMLGLVQKLGGDIDRIACCPHHPEQDCSCRKPKPGMFTELLADWPGPADQVPAVGDSLRDLQAAEAGGTSPVLVLTGNGAGTRSKLAADSPIPVFDDLAAYTNHLLEEAVS